MPPAGSGLCIVIIGSGVQLLVPASFLPRHTCFFRFSQALVAGRFRFIDARENRPSLTREIIQKGRRIARRIARGIIFSWILLISFIARIE